MKPIKYDTVPMIRGANLSSRFEISLSVLSFLAQKTMIAIGSADVKTSDMISHNANRPQSKLKLEVKGVPLDASTIQIIENRGIHIIGGFVNVDIVLAILSFLGSFSSYLLIATELLRFVMLYLQFLYIFYNNYFL